MEPSTTAGQGVSSEWVAAFVERWLAAWNSREPERLLGAGDGTDGLR